MMSFDIAHILFPFVLVCVCKLLTIVDDVVCGFVAVGVEGGTSRPLFPQWSHHVYPQFLPGSHPNAVSVAAPAPNQHHPRHHTAARNNPFYKQNHYNINNNNHHYHHYQQQHHHHHNNISQHHVTSTSSRSYHHRSANVQGQGNLQLRHRRRLFC